MVPPFEVMYMELPSALKSMLSNDPLLSVQLDGKISGLLESADGLVSVPSGLSSTMLGVGVPPLPEFPTNMCPVPSITTACALLEFAPPFALKVLTGVCGTVVAGTVRGFRLAIEYTITLDWPPPALSVTTACKVLLIATPRVSPLKPSEN